MVTGLTTGVWMARIPAVKEQAHLSDGALGAALFTVPIGLVLGAAVAERLIDRMGSARVARVCGFVSCAVIVAPGLAANLAELMAALLASGTIAGTLDVAQNAQGVRVEAAYGRPVMTSMHAFYSLGAIAGALAGGGLAWAGVGPAPSLAAGGLTGAAIVAVTQRWLLPGKHHGTSTGTQGPSLARRDRTGAWRLVIALGVLGISALVAEGAAGDWSAVYLHDNLGTSAGFAALGFAAFSVTMTAGRLVGDRLIHRFSVAGLVRVCGLVAAAGLAGALATGSRYGAIAGFAVFGAGLSVVVPQVFAAGGRADPARPGSGLAKVVGLGYAGMAAGPAVIGVVASRVGLRLAFGIPVLLALWIAVAAPVLGWRARTAYGMSMDDKEILARISGLIQTEHELRSQLAAGQLSSEQERMRLRSAEEALDQCWDLLRQRRARREFGEDPDSAAVRPAVEVEGYQQ